MINKTHLAPHVGVSPEWLARDAKAQRGGRPFVLASLRHGVGVEEIVAFLMHQGGCGRLIRVPLDWFRRYSLRALPGVAAGRGTRAAVRTTHTETV